MFCIDLAAKVSDCPKKPLEMPLHSDGEDAVIRRIRRRAGDDGGVDGHNTPSKPLGGDFVFPPLFVGLLSLQGDTLFGGQFLSWQVASSPTSPTSDAAAPDVEVPPPFALVPPPFALSGANPFLHA